MQNYDLAALQYAVTQRLSPGRIAHTLSCMREALRLAGDRPVDRDVLSRAALLHDVTKELSLADHLKICDQWDIILSCPGEDCPAVLHQFTGAAVAEHEFGQSSAVCACIRSHTTGCVGMTEEQQILFLADLTEPERSIAGDPHVCLVRRLAELDTLQACAEQLSFEIDRLRAAGRPVYPDTLAAYEDICKKIG